MLTSGDIAAVPLRDDFARPLRIHHVAFAHRNTSKPHDRFEQLLGLRVCDSEDAPGFVERMIPVGDSYVQTLESTGPGVVEKFVGKRGPALHHVGFEVEGLDAHLRRLRQHGVRLIDQEPRPGGMGTMIAFIHPKEFHGRLVELVEVPAAGP